VQKQNVAASERSEIVELREKNPPAHTSSAATIEYVNRKKTDEKI